MFPTVDSEDISQVTSFTEKQNHTSDERDPTESSQEALQNNNRDLTLNMLIKELVFCIALALTTYGALHNSPTKVSKHPQAVRFFDSESVVTDWYRGQLGNALAAINLADVSFVMYYAPWDAESQFVRSEFEEAANVLSDRVHFAAINCWNPGSECRLQHNKIPSWPILMAYTVNSKGVLYKGPRDAHHMVNFLQLIMKPLERVSTVEDFVKLLSIYDAFAIAYTPLTDTSKYYNVWYNVALKSREFDTVGEICFAVVTSTDLAAQLGMGPMPTASLMVWNETKEFKLGSLNRAWNESNLMEWVLENFSQPVARIIPMWKKSFNFERYADGNPMLILFTPLNPIYEQLPAYALLREVAMEYYNCNKSNVTNQRLREMMKLQHVQRLLYQQRDISKFCQEYKFEKSVSKSPNIYPKEIVSSNNKYLWNNITQRNQKKALIDYLLKQDVTVSKDIQSDGENTQFLSPFSILNECATKFLPAEKSFYENFDQCRLFENKDDIHIKVEVEQESAETTLNDANDPLSPENLIQDNIKHFCRLHRFAGELGPPILPAKVSGANITRVEGLACAANSSLYMIAVDSVQNHHFPEALGIDITKKKDMTAVVILDSKHGSQYVLSEEYSAKSIRDFIYKFTRNGLRRTLRTQVDAAHTHYYGPQTGDDAIAVTDLTTRTFRKFVTTRGKVSLVAVCGGSCGAHVSRSLLSAARLLSRCGVPARAARLDATSHDLPVHLDVHLYPAVLVFDDSSGGEADSRAYPLNERVTSGGIVALALRSLGVPNRLRARVALCGAASNIEKRACLRDLREHITTVIGTNLKYWRRTDVRELKDSILKRLQHLNRISLHLSLLNSADLKEDSPKLTPLLDAIVQLTSVWNIDVKLLGKNSIGTNQTR